MSKELPGKWGELLGPKGIHSYRDIAARVGVSPGTAHRLVTGGATSAETVNRVADSLFGGDRDLVWQLRGSRRRDHGDWSLPPEASLLTPPQRDAVIAVVNAMVPAEHEERDVEQITEVSVREGKEPTIRVDVEDVAERLNLSPEQREQIRVGLPVDEDEERLTAG